MTTRLEIVPTHKAIKTYYAALQAYADQQVKHETALRSAFQSLLSDLGRKIGWTLIPELSGAAAPPGHGGRVQPDGTLRDEFYIERGYWEAKDTEDDLEVEIKKKIAKGYPLTNTIFEDTRQARLYQNGKLEMIAELVSPQQLCDLLTTFFTHAEPAHDNFEKAVSEFKQRVPDLARGLVDLIGDAHKTNDRFKKAFEDFYESCRTSLNPNLRREAVDEMLVQHLLTERLIRTIFDNQDFIRRNVIAAEVEKVIDALVSKSFNRHDFLKQLDRFYLAIEDAARTIKSFSEKQHFLNVVYERFFQGYCVKVADTHGIVYTPQEIVDFMCAGVEDVLNFEFGKSLGDRDVHILDPCVGTGNFIVNLINRIPKRDLPRVYKEQVFANEVMLLPYYIAALNIEHAYYQRAGQYEPFEGLCFVDSLGLAEAKPGKNGTDVFPEFFGEANARRVLRQAAAPITVIIGNPPYNVGQLNENDNNKNRRYPAVEERIRETYAKDSQATNKNALWDAYVKFFRWATDRLTGDGIVCFVSNNSFVEQIAFDGMRKHLLGDFTRIYHVHLEGNVRHDFRLAGTIYNVFGIQVGVGITVAVRSSTHKRHRLYLQRVDKLLRRQRKLEWLAQQRAISGLNWRELKPDAHHTWLLPDHAREFESFILLGPKQAKPRHAKSVDSLFQSSSPGVKTNRDEVLYGFNLDCLELRVKGEIESFCAELDRFHRAKQRENVDEFVDYTRIKWSETLKRRFARGEATEYRPALLRHCMYRPFVKKWLYFDDFLVERRYLQHQFFPTPNTENTLIWIKVGGVWPVFPFASDQVVDLMPVSGSQCFPFHTHDADGSNRRENITDWALKLFRNHFADKRIAKWDIFHYIYSVLHHKGYREKFADCLKRELPRIPLAESRDDFRAFRDAGRTLAKLHVEYESVEPWPLTWIETPDLPLSYRVEKMKLSKDKKSLYVNDSLALGDIPPEVFDYRLGNRSALEWVIDQYQVSTDKQSGIASDPNREEDPEYIVRLVGQVVRVSVETVKIVDGLPKDYGGPPAKDEASE